LWGGTEGETCEIRRKLRVQAQGCLLGGQILADSEGGDILNGEVRLGRSTDRPYVEA
jgi:hypothetical protein